MNLKDLFLKAIDIKKVVLVEVQTEKSIGTVLVLERKSDPVPRWVQGNI